MAEALGARLLHRNEKGPRERGRATKKGPRERGPEVEFKGESVPNRSTSPPLAGRGKDSVNV